MSDCYGLQMVREGDELGSNAKNGPHPLHCAREHLNSGVQICFFSEIRSDGLLCAENY